MSTAGELNLERPGINRDAVTEVNRDGSGNITSVVVTYDNGTTTATYTQTYTRDVSGNITDISKWVKS